MRGPAAVADRAALAAGVSFLLTGWLLSVVGADPVAVAATPPGPEPTVVEVVARTPAASQPTAAPLDVVVDPLPPDALLTFRGNTMRTFHGTGPIGTDPVVEWAYPQRGGLCAESAVGEEVRTWCGTGWTGQPAVFHRDGRTWVVVGAYDRAVHFIDGDTGAAILPPFPTGDIIKGSVTIDPDGHPIVYSGSRDGRYRAIAFDGDAPRELWSMSAADATGPTMWNDDWDSSGLVVDGHLVVGGENSRLWVVRLDRGRDDRGLVTLEAEVVADVAGFDEELLADVGDRNVSIEGSVAVHDGTVWFATSGGLVQGWDLVSLTGPGEPRRTFRWWIGDDVDATVVIDPASGDLLVAAELERHTARSREVGQIVRLDPGAADPLVWGVHDRRGLAGAPVAGVWATPALWRDLVLVPTTGGTVMALDVVDGSLRWSLELGDHLWSSPLVIDDVLLQGDCGGTLHAYELASGAPEDPPPLRWSLPLGGGCIESTPAVLDGRLYVGTRAGQVLGVALDG